MSARYGITGGPPVIEPGYQDGGKDMGTTELGKYLLVREVDYRDDKRLTRMWFVKSKSSRAVLGIIQWWPSWRCYTFIPREGTVLNSGCMLDIAQFMDDNRASRREDPA